jgi:hypothetical protein
MGCFHSSRSYDDSSNNEKLFKHPVFLLKTSIVKRFLLWTLIGWFLGVKVQTNFAIVIVVIAVLFGLFVLSSILSFVRRIHSFLRVKTATEAQAALDAKIRGETKVKAKNRQMPVWIVWILPLGSIIPLGIAVAKYRDESLGSALWPGAIGLLFLAIGLVAILQQRQTRRVADAMATVPTRTPPSLAASATPDPGLPRLAPPARVEMIASATLPPAVLPNNLPTPECNVAGCPPISILFLYNFYSFETLLTKMDGSWCRYGPVFFLGSPSDLGSGHTFARDIKKLAENELITSPSAFDARFDSASRDLLPAGDPRLKSYPHITGGWPQHGFLCTDASWRHGVERLFDAAEVVIMDASDYSLERGGLNWEIQQLINRVDATNLLVLADDTADLDALKNAFENAWAQMRSDGPNNRRDAGPVRIVVYPGESEARSAEQHAQARGSPPDPTGRFAAMNVVMRLTGAYARACEHDRAMAFLLASRS